jgi:6-phosphofructokinase 1
MYVLPTLAPTRRLRSIAVITSGGDAPGMNSAIRSVTRAALAEGIQVYGFQRGYTGLVAETLIQLDSHSVSNIIQRGGTFLRTDRCDDFRKPEVRARCGDFLKANEIDALVVIGGDGSLTGAALLSQETGIPVIGLPGTIDNDIYGTDDTIGFRTAINTAVEAVDRIRDTASSHERLFLVEVMGRNSGFLASEVGIACGAEMVVVPEENLTTAEICERLIAQQNASRTSAGITVVAEGKEPGASYQIASHLRQYGYDPKVCVLGHVQRGGSPSSHDRILASSLGASAIRYLLAGIDDVMVGVRKGEVNTTPLNDVLTRRKQLDPEWLKLAQLLHN